MITNILSLTALFISIYVLYQNHLRRCKIEVSVGDKIGIIKSVGVGAQKIHLNCNFINNTNRNGVIDKIILEIEVPDGNKYLFDWDEFYQYVGNQGVKPEALPFPIAVDAKNSVFKGIQFKMLIHPRREGAATVWFDNFDWVKGEYMLTIKGWANKTNINEPPNIFKEYKMVVTPFEIDKITTSTPATIAQVVHIPLEEWKLRL
jgi:hypothetical protein